MASGFNDWFISALGILTGQMQMNSDISGRKLTFIVYFIWAWVLKGFSASWHERCSDSPPLPKAWLCCYSSPYLSILQLSASVAVAVISHFAVISLSYHRLQLSFREKTCRQALEGQHGEKCRNSRVLRTIDEFPQIASLVIVMTTFLVSFLCFLLHSAIFWDLFLLATVVWSIFAWQGFEHP